MKVNSDDMRRYVSKKYLDFAERSHLTNIDQIQALKQIRNRQVKYAEEMYERTRPPAQARLIPLSTRILELYRIEEFMRFHKSLFAFLPELSTHIHRSILETLRNFDRREGTLWLNLGEIARVPLLGNVLRYDTNLPAAINYISLKLYRVLPSIFILVIDVFYSESHLSDLEELLDKQYYPEVMLHDLLLHNEYGIPHTFGNSEQVLANAIANWEADLRHHIATYFKPILFGFFSAASKPKYGDLPFLDVWALQGSPENRTEHPAWEERHSRWLQSVGFYHFSTRYQNAEYILEYPSESLWNIKEQVMRQGRLIVLEKQFAKLHESKRYGDHLLSFMCDDSSSVLDDFLVFSAIGAFVHEANESLLQFRNLLFDRLKSPTNTYSLIELHQEISRQRSLASSILRDFNYYKEWLGDHHSGALTQLKYITREGHTNSILLVERVRSDVEQQLERLQEKYQAVELELNNYVTLRNMKQNHRLQVIAILLSIGALLVALFQPQLTSLINSLWKLMLN